MRIDFVDDKFVAHIAFEEREAFKRDPAWKWSPDLRKFTTVKFSAVAPLEAFCTEAALYALEAPTKVLLPSLAVDTDLHVPAPPGLNYFDYQRAGIEYASKRKDVLIADPPGLGKGGPLWAKILTPTGWITYADVRVGDAVVGSDGKAHKVTGVYPRGSLEVYRVEFSDGAVTHVDADHLWSVQGPAYKKRSGVRSVPNFSIRKTRDLINLLHYPSGDSRKFRIPVVKPVVFEPQSEPLVIRPYTIGVLLGDGCIRKCVEFANIDAEIIEAIRDDLPEDMELHDLDGCSYRIRNIGSSNRANKYVRELRSLELLGTGSDDKFIPDCYKFASIEERVAIVQGLLDTDGYCSTDGTIQFSSNSQQLVDDFLFIINSLGATGRKTQKISASGKDHFIVTCCFPEGFVPFRLSRKMSRHSDRTKYHPSRLFKSITSIGSQEVVCISVDSPDSLYVTDDFIVTHNTLQAIGLANLFPSTRRVLIVCPSSLKVNWKREWIKWDVKNLSVGIAETKESSIGIRDDEGKIVKRKSVSKQIWPDTDVVIVSYDMLPKFYAEATALTWHLLIFDESQYLVSHNSIRSRHVFGAPKQKKPPRPATVGLQGLRRVFLSGTPILSRPADLWTICKACDPDDLGRNWMTYAYQYCAAFTFGKGSKSEHLNVQGASNLSELQHKLRTKFMVRRPKSILNLPPKTRQLVPLPSEGLAKAIADEMSAMERVKEALGLLEAINDGEAAGTPDYEYTTLADALEQRFAGYQDKSYDECIHMLSEPEQVAFEELSVARKALAAAKVPMVVEFLQNTLATTQKVIVFVVHTEMATALKEAFPDAAMITGKTVPSKRQDQVDRFQNDPSCRLFIGNITAAGVGFTMTASHTVVFAELDWVPAKIEQAEDRAWRIGQQNAVLILHLAVENSLDAHLVNVLIEKQAVIFDALDAEHSVPASFTIDDVLAYERQMDDSFRLLLQN